MTAAEYSLADAALESPDAWRVLADFVDGVHAGHPLELATQTRDRISAALRQAASMRDGEALDAPGLADPVRYRDVVAEREAVIATAIRPCTVHLVENHNGGHHLYVTHTDDPVIARAAVRAHVAAHRTGPTDWESWNEEQQRDEWMLDRLWHRVDFLRSVTPRATRVAQRPLTPAESATLEYAYMLTERDGRGSTPAVIWEDVL